MTQIFVPLGLSQGHLLRVLDGISVLAADHAFGLNISRLLSSSIY